MLRSSKILLGGVAAALVTVSAAAPADAQRYRRYQRHHDGIDAGDVIAGVAIIGGIAAIASAIDRDSRRYGYERGYRYRDGYSRAVNSCGYEAERHGRGRVSVTDVDRRDGGYRVRGWIEGYGYGRDRYDRYDRYGRYSRYDRGDDRLAFTCWAGSSGRVMDFDVNRYRW